MTAFRATYFCFASDRIWEGGGLCHLARQENKQEIKVCKSLQSDQIFWMLT